MKIALDGRYETVYEEKVANEYFDYMNGKENGFLDAYDHDLLLFKPDRPPVRSIRSNRNWMILYEDTGSILFAKIQGAGKSSAMPGTNVVAPAQLYGF